MSIRLFDFGIRFKDRGLFLLKFRGGAKKVQRNEKVSIETPNQRN